MNDIMNAKFAPVHAGEILLEEFLKPLGITQYRMAQDTSRMAFYRE
jgi:plasmid maintenance system antidote protein VapI